jgi:hypothetical protein
MLLAAGFASGAASALGSQSTQVAELKTQVHETRTLEDVVLAPIAILVAILAAGGVFGIVFSVRDQRRTSQLHELTIGAEVLSQRRTEQSYASFLEQSQTTLSLVNDTLRLAKETTDRAAHSMELKAKARLEEIETRAEQLMLQVFSVDQFAAIVSNPGFRSEVHSIGDALRSLEGYLSLQELEIPHYTKFVRAIDQFLRDDVETAIHALDRASQNRLVGDLQRFTLYWLGYMYTTVGDYGLALRTFRDDEIGLPADDSERFQLDRVIIEARFFERVKAMYAKHASTSSDDHEPSKRFKAVASLLDELRTLAENVKNSISDQDLSNVACEITRTRADIYTWIAYDAAHVDDPVDPAAVRRAETVAPRPLEPTGDLSRTVGGGEPEMRPTMASGPAGALSPPTRQADENKGPTARFVESATFSELDDPVVFRAWALIQASAICRAQTEQDFSVLFALAEARFLLSDDEAESTYQQVEHKLTDERGEYLEKRRIASLHEASLICHVRLHHLRHQDEQQRRHETRNVQQVAGRLREAMHEMRPGRTTIFSQIQRRNLSHGDFNSEIDRIVHQEKLDPKDEHDQGASETTR